MSREKYRATIRARLVGVVRTILAPILASVFVRKLDTSQTYAVANGCKIGIQILEPPDVLHDALIVLVDDHRCLIGGLEEGVEPYEAIEVLAASNCFGSIRLRPAYVRLREILLLKVIRRNDEVPWIPHKSESK